ncbi:YisL family protein, partial [Staphylococcus aureus]|nr:YisL family protein [Staphylococcus aureus]
MLHLHILSWVLAIILFIATYLNISKNQGGTPYFKPLHMVLRLFMLLTLISGFWILIQSFMNGGANHMLLTLKMLCGVAVVGLME